MGMHNDIIKSPEIYWNVLDYSYLTGCDSFPEFFVPFHRSITILTLTWELNPGSRNAL
jgi:hypothetical protein